MKTKYSIDVFLDKEEEENCEKKLPQHDYATTTKQAKEEKEVGNGRTLLYLFTNVKDDFNIIDDEEKQERKNK